MAEVKTSDALMGEYKDYYADGSVDAKREIMGRQALKHVRTLTGGQRFDTLLDVGCGEGSFLLRAAEAGLASRLFGIEISDSGIAETQAKGIKGLVEVQKFDGYSIPYPDKSFDFGIVAHVIEHVEHERLFLTEVARVCKSFYIETPLEDTASIERSIAIASKYGHINFYSEKRFLNLMKTSEGIASVKASRVFAHDLEYEVNLSGRLKGTVKNMIRSSLLKFAPTFAMRRMVYVIGAVCVSK